MKTNEIKWRMAELFAELCAGLSIAPIDASLGARSSACFERRGDALTLEQALRAHGAPGARLDGSDDEGDEWQVSWGDL